MRPPRRGDTAPATLAHRTLMELGAVANELGRTQAALKAFVDAVKSGAYPQEEHTYS